MKRLIWLVVAMFVASLAGAQSLAEVAKKEKERRARLDEEKGRTITDFELRRNYRGPLTTSTTQTGAQTEGEEDDADADADADDAETDERQTESYWRERLRPIDERIQRMETQLQSPEYTTNVRGGRDRERLEQQLAQARADRQAVLDEARRQGVPPGWLR